jgi:hypothetical protein
MDNKTNQNKKFTPQAEKKLTLAQLDRTRLEPYLTVFNTIMLTNPCEPKKVAQQTIEVLELFDQHVRQVRKKYKDSDQAE